jgi:hypothetical protein
MSRILAIASASVLVLLGACSRTDGEDGQTPAEAPAASAAAGGPRVAAATPEEAGRYLAIVGGCHDCHTPGYMEAVDGNVPQELWLTGLPVGFQGPWGTTYPKNLRLTVAERSEDEFVQLLHTRKTLPPMPWANVNRLHEQDARALYRFIKSLGPGGTAAPENAPPGQTPKTPYIVFAPPTVPPGVTPPPAPGPTPTGGGRAAASRG